MTEEILSLLLGAVASTAGAGLVALLSYLMGRIRPREPGPTYGERLKKLMENLTRSSQEVDSVLAELAEVARNREEGVKKLEEELAILEKREGDLKDKIDVLQTLPLPVAEHFAELVEIGQHRSARRDYLLFGAGVLVTTAIAIAIQVLIP